MLSCSCNGVSSELTRSPAGRLVKSWSGGMSKKVNGSDYDPAEERRQIARIHAEGKMWSPDKPEGVPVKEKGK